MRKDLTSIGPVGPVLEDRGPLTRAMCLPSAYCLLLYLYIYYLYSKKVGQLGQLRLSAIISGICAGPTRWAKWANRGLKG